MLRRLIPFAAPLLLGGALAPAPAAADDDDRRRGRRHAHRGDDGHRHHGYRREHHREDAWRRDEWQRREAWRRDAYRRDRGYRTGPPVAYAVPQRQPLIQFNLRQTGSPGSDPEEVEFDHRALPHAPADRLAERGAGGLAQGIVLTPQRRGHVVNEAGEVVGDLRCLLPRLE